jgi:murein DD-endopeptidase MepM/ murein hydrolase activator NlpD
VRVRGAPLVGAVGCAGALCAGGAVVSASDNARPSASAAAMIDLTPRGYPQRPPLPHRARPSDELRWPLHGEITGRFGEPRGGRMHEGIDIPMPAGTPIRAAGDGTVVMREVQAGYGKYTCVAHRTITTCYAHQARFRTRLGDKVKRGQVIGAVGSTGNTSVTHLHFEVRRGTKPWGEPMNPKRFLPRGR